MRCRERSCVWPVVSDGLCALHLRQEREIEEMAVYYAEDRQLEPLLDRLGKREQTREILIGKIRNLALELGRTPKHKELETVGIRSAEMQRTFGSGYLAMRAAGLEPRRRGQI